MKSNYKAFTLVELLAVIVVLAVILLIAVPQIMNVIVQSKRGAIESTSKMIASSAEEEYMERLTLGTLDQDNNPIECIDVVKLSSKDYENCKITFDSKNKAVVTIVGKGRFDSIACFGVKDDMTCESMIPNTYSRLEYIESTGTQYIDTGFIQTSTLTVDCKFDIISSYSDYLFGGQQVNYMMYNGLYGHGHLEYNFSLINSSSVDNPVIMTQKINNNNIEININGSLYTRPIGNANPSNLYIFACNGGDRKYKGDLKLYYFKVKDNNILVRNMVPAMKKENNKLGMYDIVNNVFYERQGESEFVSGNIIY